jgi:hypothetical protein
MHHLQIRSIYGVAYIRFKLFGPYTRGIYTVGQKPMYVYTDTDTNTVRDFHIHICLYFLCTILANPKYIYIYIWFWPALHVAHNTQLCELCIAHTAHVPASGLSSAHASCRSLRQPALV